MVVCLCSCTDIENDLSSYDITSYYLHPGSAKDFLSSNMVFITIRLWGKGVSYISATIAKQTLQHFYKCSANYVDSKAATNQNG